MRHFLRAAWQDWKRIAETIGRFQAKLLWGLLYFVVVTPFALALKVLSDPLRIKRRPSSSWWVDKPRQTLTLEEARRQF